MEHMKTGPRRWIVELTLCSIVVIVCPPIVVSSIRQAIAAETPLAPELGHKEMPDDLPASSRQQRTSPARSVVRGPFVSVQVNVNASGMNIIGDAANEPSIAIDPTDPNRIAIGWRQFDDVASNFRQAGRGYSQDGGQTWTAPGPLTPGVFRSDPVLDFNADGVFYYHSLMSDFSCQLFHSQDGGVTWPAAFPAFGGDKAWMSVDRTDGIGRGNLYFAWSSVAGCCADRIFTRSTDGGFTFLEPIVIPENPRWGTLAVGPDGALYVSGQATSSSAFLAKSTNAQNPSVTPSFDFTTSVFLGGSTAFSTGPNPAGLLGQVWVATDRSGGPNANNVYILASVNPPGGDPLDVKFARSTDGGLTWSSPVRINDDSAGSRAWQWFGTMSTAPNGRIDAVWNDTRADSGATFSELYFSYSLDGGVSWETKREDNRSDRLAALGIALRYAPSEWIAIELSYARRIFDLPSVLDRDLQDTGAYFRFEMRTP